MSNFDLRQSEYRDTPNMIGDTPLLTADALITNTDAEMGKLFEDRNLMLTDGGTIGFTGTSATFSENLKLTINQKISGAVPQVISLGATTRSFGNGDMMIAVVDRTAGTAVVSMITAGNPLPAATFANQEVFLIAKRVDAGDATKRLYFRTGMALDEGQSARLGAVGSGSPTPTPSGNCPTYEELVTYQLVGAYNAADFEVRLQNRLTSFPTGNCPCG